MMSSVSIFGFPLRPLLGIVFILLFAPTIVSAGKTDSTAKLFNFIGSTIEGGKRGEQRQQGIIVPEVEEQLKETGQWDELQALLESFPDEQVKKEIRGLYIGRNEVGNKNSLFRKKFLKSAVDLDISAAELVGGGLGVSNIIPVSLEDVAKPPLWARITMGVKDIVGAVKTLFSREIKQTSVQSPEKNIQQKETNLPASISKPLLENLDKTPESQPAQGQSPNTEAAKDSGQQPALQWKTIDENLFSIKIPGAWNEVAPRDKNSFADNSEQPFRFQGGAGDYFQITINPTPRGMGCTDADWKLKTNSSGDGVVVEKEITAQGSEMCGNTRGDGKLDIAAFAKDSNSQNIPLQGHIYYFFFGNSKKEADVDTEIFKEILSSFRAKTETQTSKPNTQLEPQQPTPAPDTEPAPNQPVVNNQQPPAESQPQPIVTPAPSAPQPPSTPQTTPAPIVKVVRAIKDNLHVMKQQTNDQPPLEVIVGITHADAADDPESWKIIGGEKTPTLLKRGEVVEYLAVKTTPVNAVESFPQSIEALQVKLQDGTIGWVVSKWALGKEVYTLAETILTTELQQPLPSVPPQANLGGTWNYLWQSNYGQSGKHNFPIEQMEGSLWFTGEGIGSYSDNEETYPFVAKGSIFGNKIFYYGYYPESPGVRSISTGTISGNTGNGTWTNTLGNSGTWSMTKEN